MADWEVFDAAGGLVRVALPPGEELESSDGYEYWSPDSTLGRFTVVRGGDADELLAAEEAGGSVEVETDVRLERGGVPARALCYRTTVERPHEIVRGPDGERRHSGGHTDEYLSEFLFLAEGPDAVRVGYSVRADAPAAIRRVLAEVLARVRVGDER